MKQNIKDLSFSDLQNWLKVHGEQAFRAEQIFHWIYQQKISRFEDFKNVSKSVKTLLSEHFFMSELTRKTVQHSQDGSSKYAFALKDHALIESVLMPHQDHYTVCVSSQVGCGMGCDFCMTGKMGLTRHLTPAEMVDQVLEVAKDVPAGGLLRNIVFMGMGEPFHNYDHLITALDILTHPLGFGFSQRRITISTSGLIPKIQRFSQEAVKANLAISLNGVTDEIRNRLMPVNRAYNIKKLIEVCKDYPLKSRKRITFEYILLKGITDSIACAQQLIALLHGLRFKINLIPFNPSPASPYQCPSEEDIRAFQRYLLDHGVVATVRISKGQDIQGACGQLIQQL